MIVRGIQESDPNPTVATWIHDLQIGRTERLDPAGVDGPRVLGVSADGDVLLLGDSIGNAHLWQRSTDRLIPVPFPAERPEITALVPIALSTDGRRGWLQWASVITDPDQRSTGLATFSHDGDLGSLSVELHDEPLPLAGSPTLGWYVRGEGAIAELVGSADSMPLSELGDPAALREVAVSDPAPDGAITLAFSSTAADLPGGGGTACGGVACAEVYRFTTRPDAAVEVLSVGNDGTRLAHDGTDVSISPSGELVAFGTRSALTAGVTPGVSNVYVAGGHFLRRVSRFEAATGPVEGGRLAAFASNNEVVYYSDVVVVDGAGGSLGLAPVPGVRVARLQPFDDMAVTVHDAAIWWALEAGLTNGCSESRYCPEHPLTRAQMATLLTRALKLEPAADGPFSDVSGVHAGAINAIAGAGITAGCDEARFCPDGGVTRGQLATFLARALELAGSDTSPFTDAGGVHAPAIAALYSAGITNGCMADRFCPERPVLRSQVATFLFRAFGPEG